MPSLSLLFLKTRDSCFGNLCVRNPESVIFKVINKRYTGKVSSKQFDFQSYKKDNP